MEFNFDENEYLDVLQNIEFALASVYREHSEMTDYNADKVVEVILREYKAENTGRTATTRRLQGVDEVTYQRLHIVCEWRLGRGEIEGPNEVQIKGDLPPISPTEMIACLKRV
jgi:hypothetical protein